MYSKECCVHVSWLNECVLISADYFVTWGARHEDGGPAVAAGAPLPPTGKPLGKLNTDDLTAVVERGLKLYSMLLNL